MRTIEGGIERRVVIEAYGRYDCAKKSRSTPDFATWDWSHADAIDREMKRAGLKPGVPAGYLLWDKVEVTMSDLRECAVVVDIFPKQSRKLGLVEGAGGIEGWRPNRKASWYDDIAGGATFDETAPLLLRPAVSGEAPASWYLEDGSGRAIAFLAYQALFRRSQTLAIGYLGREPDSFSSLMRQHFREFL